MGISGDDIADIRFLDTAAVKKVITIENLTTYFRWREEDSLLVYLGGYHNSVRRKLLRDMEDREELKEVVAYMLEHNVKLEQECINGYHKYFID